MAATALLLKASCCSFLSVHRDSRPLKWRRNHPVLMLPTTTQIPFLLPSIKKTTTTTGGFSVQCVMNNNSKNCFMEDEDDDEEEEERKRNHQNPLNERFAEMMMLSGILFLAYDPYSSAIAASGGRMGGSSFSSSSSPSSSSSYSSSPSSSSSYSSSSDDHSSSPSYSFSISSPTSSTHSMDKSGSISESSWPVFLFIIAYTLYCEIISTITRSRSRSQWERNTPTNTQQTTTVLKLQVGLMGMKRSLQRALDQIAETADTSTSKGLSYILQETTSLLQFTLLNHPACCISGYSSVYVKQSIEDGEKLFNRLCIEERGKFDEETLVNVDNNKRQNTSSKGANGVSNEYMVITILVAAKGVHRLPTINGIADLKETLQKLGSISFNKTMAALEVLWTPQKENDTLTEQELREDYPLLRPLYKDQDTQPLEK